MTMRINISRLFLCASLLAAGACRGKTGPVNHKPEPVTARAEDGTAPTTQSFEEKETCEGTIDTRSVVRFASDGRMKILVDLVWTGSEYALAWIGYEGTSQDIYFARVSSKGRMIGGVHRITQEDAVRDLAMAWTGNGFGIVWMRYKMTQATQDHDLYFRLLDAAGKKTGAEKRVTRLGRPQPHLAMAWTGDLFGIAWVQENHISHFLKNRLLFTTLDAEGRVLGDEEEISLPFEYNPDLLWTGSAFALAWERKEGPCGIPGHVSPGCKSIVYFQRLDKTGTSLDTRIRVTRIKHDTQTPALAWTGSSFAVAWEDDRDYWKSCPPACKRFQVYLTALDEKGGKVGDESRITDHVGIYPDLVWTGSGFAVVWTDVLHSIDVRLLDPLGGKKGTPLNLSSSPAYGTIPRLAWTGSELGAAWIESGDSSSEVTMARIGICP
jgi:hypothetical protein